MVCVNHKVAPLLLSQGSRGTPEILTKFWVFDPAEAGVVHPGRRAAFSADLYHRLISQNSKEDTQKTQRKVLRE